MAVSFASRLGSVYSDAWSTASTTPNLVVRMAHPGRLPPCAQRGEPVFWVHQAGLFRSFAAHVEHLRSFLDASSSCWFVVLFTLDIQDSAVTAWNRGAKTLRFAGDPGQEVRDAIAALQNATNGGAAYAMASRSHEKPRDHRGEAAHTSGTNPKLEAFAHVLREQNVGASALLGREVVAWHDLATDPGDVILQTRPDVIFKASIDAAKLRTLFRGATTARVGGGSPPLLLMTEDADGIKGNAPSGDSYILARAALSRLWPDGRPAGRSGEAVNDVTCGHSEARLLVHVAQRAGISSFFIRPDAWGIRIHRPNERGCHWMGRRSDCFGRPGASVPLSADDPPVDMTFGLRAVLGQNSLGESACVASTPLVTATRWGPAFSGLGFAYGGSFFVGLASLDTAALLAPLHPRRSQTHGRRGNNGSSTSAAELRRFCATVGSCTAQRLQAGLAAAGVGAASLPLEGRAGVCSGTDSGESDCARSRKGSWSTVRYAIGDLDACVQRCKGCKRCHFVSFSPLSQDCSWYANCDLDRLLTEAVGQAFDFVTVKS